jgi:hypothetical protein
LKVNEYVDRFWIFTCPRRQLRAATSCWQCRALLAPSLDEVNRRSTPSSVQMQNPSLEDSTM